jgi:hypothetical protein
LLQRPAYSEAIARVPEKALDGTLTVLIGYFNQPKKVASCIEITRRSSGLSLLLERTETVRDYG